MTGVRIDVFGPMRVRIDGADVPILGSRRRRLLAALVLRRGVECRADWLAEVVWDGSPPAAATATLQSHVAHLRKLLEPQRRSSSPWQLVTTVPDGYLLAAERVDVDVDRVIAGVHAARLADDPDVALALLDDALRRCRGDAFADESDRPPFEVDATRLDEFVLGARERRLDLLIDRERDDEVIAAATELVQLAPLRERNWARLAGAQARRGRSADALRTLGRLRTLLRDELGLDPSPDIAELELQVLRHGLRPSPGNGTVSGPLGQGNGTEPSGGAGRRDGEVPPTVYAASDDGVHIAYQVVRRSPRRVPVLVAAPPLAQNIGICWEDPHHRRLIERAARRTTFVHFDKRGTGMSDRVVELSLDRRLRDFEAVLDHAEIERAVLAGVSEAGPLAIAFAVAHPERVSGLALVNTFACAVAADHEAAITQDGYDAVTAIWEAGWGRHPSRLLEWFAPSMCGDEHYGAWLAHYMRQSCSPGTLRLINEANGRIDVRPLLARLAVPVLVVHRTGDRVCSIAQGRHLAEHIPGARLVEVDGADHLPWIGDTWQELIDHVLDFTERVW